MEYVGLLGLEDLASLSINSGNLVLFGVVILLKSQKIGIDGERS